MEAVPSEVGEAAALAVEAYSDACVKDQIEEEGAVRAA